MRYEKKFYPQKSNPKHGMHGTRTYNIWKKMKQRCLNPKHTNYCNYGGRGITICDRWLDFENFFEDIGEIKKPFCLDRINNDEGYSKENCRVTTYQVNNLNRRCCSVESRDRAEKIHKKISNSRD